MSGAEYDAFEDPYCYRGTFVLKNKAKIRDAALLQAFELEMSSLRAEEAFPVGRFDPAHYRAFHKHLFGDVYAWAGKYRSVRTGKGGNAFCYPEHIPAQMDRLFEAVATPNFASGVSRRAFVGAAAQFLADLNAIHPFREGNGRTQLSFLYALSIQADHPLDLTKIAPTRFLSAMIRSFDGEISALTRQLARLY